MSKKHRKHKARMPKRQQIQQPRRWVRGLFAYISALLLLLGSFVSVLELLPKISVSVSDTDPTRPFLSSFTITNEGYLPLHHVSVGLGIKQIDLGNMRTFSGPPDFGATFFRSDKWIDHTLEPQEMFSITPDDFLQFPNQKGTPESADIAVVVSYKAWAIPIPRKHLFRFQTRKLGTGEIHWFSQPLDQP
jgi:hypothetical protein